MLFKRKISTDVALSTVTTRLAEDISALSQKKANAVSAFRAAANNLAQVNDALQTEIDHFDNLAAFIADKKAEAERMVADNNAVRGKIIDLIGEE